MPFTLGACDSGVRPPCQPAETLVGSARTIKEIKTFLTAAPFNQLQFTHMHH